MSANSISKLILSASILILSVSCLIYVSKNAQAEPLIKTGFSPDASHGKYMMQYLANVDANGNFYWHMLLWNSETGNYKTYRWDRDAQEWKGLFSDSKAFPALP